MAGRAIFVIENGRTGECFVGMVTPRAHYDALTCAKWKLAGYLREAESGQFRSVLSEAIARHGPGPFTVRVVEECGTEADAYEARKAWREELQANVRGKGYNVGRTHQRGPEAQQRLHSKTSARQIRAWQNCDRERVTARMRDAAVLRWQDPEYRARMTGRSGRPKLDAGRVEQIRSLGGVGDFDMADAAERFGVSIATIFNIVTGRSWRKVA